MPKKIYTLSIESGVMESFQKGCRGNNVKYSNKIEELLNDFNNGNIISLGDADGALSDIKDTVNKFKEIVNSLDSVVNPIEDYNESEDFSMGDFDE